MRTRMTDRWFVSNGVCLGVGTTFLDTTLPLLNLYPLFGLSSFLQDVLVSKFWALRPPLC